MPLSSGQILNNRYRIDKLLGQGGMGAVYRAWDIALDRLCALKENLDTSEAAQRQFAREAKMLANLSHPNLPRVTDHFVLPGQGQYLVMDFVEGKDFQEVLLWVGGPLPETQVLLWIRQICDALEYLHSQNPPIIHRDIKPANIKITFQGKAMLVDFGIAKLYDPSHRTTIGARAVTPGYSPVEQYGQRSTDIRTDVYALGATLYTVLTGQAPTDSIDRVAGMALLSIKQLNPQINPQIEGVIFRAMEVLPERRYQSVAELKVALLQASGLVHNQSLPVNQGMPVTPTSTVVVPGLQLGNQVSQSADRGEPSEIVLQLSPGITLSLVYIPAGEFLMGTDKLKNEKIILYELPEKVLPNELPQHRVYLNEFWIGKMPVTNTQYQAFIEANGYRQPDHWNRGVIPKNKEQHPVVQVSWDDAIAFCNWVNQVTGKRLRLPTEAEWEKAARGGLEGKLYPWGDQMPMPDCWRANLYGCEGDTTTVGSYPPNGYGLFDMAGNIWEWVWDWYSEGYYSNSPYKNPCGPDSGKSRVQRGGSWDGGGWFSRVAFRAWSDPANRGLFNGGFRCAC